MTRAPLLALAAVPLLSLPCRAEEPPSAPPGVRPPLDLTARLRATGDGLILDVGGARLEVRASAEPPRPPDPRPPPAAHELRAAISLDGETTHLLLRFTPPPDGAAARQPAPGARP